MELKELEAVLPTACPLRRLRYLKTATHAATELLAEQCSPDATPEPLTETTQALMRVDRCGLRELPALLAARPRLEALSPGIAGSSPTEALKSLHSLATQQARDQAIKRFRNSMTNGTLSRRRW